MNVNWTWTHPTGGYSDKRSSFSGWRLGWNEGRSVPSKNNAELSEIIMEINDLRRFRRQSPIDLNRTADVFNLAICR